MAFFWRRNKEDKFSSSVLGLDKSLEEKSKGAGHAFLSPARCGGTHLTVTAYSQAGDEQVTTSLG